MDKRKPASLGTDRTSKIAGGYIISRPKRYKIVTVCSAGKLHICRVPVRTFLKINDDKGKSSSSDVSMSTTTTSMAHKIGLMD
jgi:hypothetical protein